MLARTCRPCEYPFSIFRECFRVSPWTAFAYCVKHMKKIPPRQATEATIVSRSSKLHK